MIAKHVFEKWREHNAGYLEKCRGKYVAVTLSAGKDSTACMYLLKEAAGDYGYEIGGFLYAFPTHRYNPDFLKKLRSFWEKQGIEIAVREATADDTILEGTENPCRPCQDLRKKDIPQIFPYIGRKPQQIVLVSGHSLWDLACYALNRFTVEKLAASTSFAESFSKDRLLEISQRFYPFLSMTGGYSVYRPMLFLNQQEIELICKEKELPLLETSCRYSQRRPKKVLGEYFERFGYQFEYDSVLDFAKTYINIAGLDEIENISPEEYLTRRF